MKDTGLENLYIFLAEKMVKHYKQGSQNILNGMKTGITIDQWVVLKYIGENTGSSQADIAKNSAKDAPTTTRIIDQLVRKKLVLRKADPGDRRKFKVGVTEKGSNLIKKVIPEILKHRKNAVKGLKDPEMKTMITSLKKMLDNLK